MKKLLFGLSWLMISLHATANCEPQALKLETFEKASQMGIKLQQSLEQYQPDIALVARVGSDLSEYGLTYSHMGIVRRDHPAGKWIFTHLLNHCQSATSSLFDEGLITFFTDSPFRYQALLIIPKPSLQNTLLALFDNGTAKKLHESRYNTLANPYGNRYQNSNQWVLELLAVAKSIYLPANQRRNAQQLAKDMGYQAERVKLSFFKQLGAKLFRHNVHFDDHNADSQASSIYPFVSVRSIVKFLKKNNEVQLIEQLNLNQTNQRLFTSAKKATKHLMKNTRPAAIAKRSLSKPLRSQSSAAFWQ